MDRTNQDCNVNPALKGLLYHAAGLASVEVAAERHRKKFGMSPAWINLQKLRRYAEEELINEAIRFVDELRRAS